MRKHKKSKAPKGGSHYRRVWRLVNGAVADALLMHPDYVPTVRQRAARESIVKRVTGIIVAELPGDGEG